MADQIGISTIVQEVGARGILLSLGKGAVQLALVVGCVVLVRRILKKLDKAKGTGLKVGWCVDEAAAREEYGLEAEKPADDEEE